MTCKRGTCRTEESFFRPMKTTLERPMFLEDASSSLTPYAHRRSARRLSGALRRVHRARSAGPAAAAGLVPHLARAGRARRHQRVPQRAPSRPLAPVVGAHDGRARAFAADGVGRLFRARVGRRLRILEADPTLLYLESVPLLVGRREPPLVVA